MRVAELIVAIGLLITTIAYSFYTYRLMRSAAMSSSLALAEFRWSTSAPSLVECTREVGTVRTGGISLAVENLGPHELVVHVTTTPGCTLSLGTSWIVPSANGARSVRISPLDAVDGRETVVRVTARSAATLTPARFAYCLKRVGDDYMIDGGNTSYLLQELRVDDKFSVLRRAVLNGKPYIGASAGAVILTSDVEYVRSIDDPEKAPMLTTTKGLGVVDFAPLPHFGNPKYLSAYFEILERHAGLDIVLLRDDQAVETRDGASYTVRVSEPLPEG